MRKAYLIILFLLLTSCNGLDTNSNRPYSHQHQPRTTTPLSPQPLTRNQENAIIVGRKKYKKQALLNKGEQALFWKLLKITSKCGVRLFPQTNFGEIFSCDEEDKNKKGYYAMQCKRADFCITDKNFNPIMVVEYHGGGHYKNDYQDRDSIKEAVANSAGIKYIAITKQDETTQLEKIANFFEKT